MITSFFFFVSRFFDGGQWRRSLCYNTGTWNDALYDDEATIPDSYE